MLTFAAVALLTTSLFPDVISGSDWVTAAGHAAEDEIDVFIGDPKHEMQQLLRGERCPNVVVAVD